MLTPKWERLSSLVYSIALSGLFFECGFVTKAIHGRTVRVGTLLSPGGKPISGPFRVLEFDTPPEIASPIGRTNPGFIGGGRTLGGAREFVIPNYSIDMLTNVTTRTVR